MMELYLYHKDLSQLVPMPFQIRTSANISAKHLFELFHDNPNFKFKGSIGNHLAAVRACSYPV